MFKNVKHLSTKLLVGFLIVTFLASAPGIISTLLLKNTDTQYSKALVENGFSQGEIGKFSTVLSKGGALVRDIVMLTNPSEVKATQAELDDMIAQLNTSLESIRAYCVTPEEKALLATIESKLPEYRTQRDLVVELGLKNENEKALAQFRGYALPVLNEIIAAADQLSALNSSLGTNVSNTLSNTSNLTVLGVSLLILVVFVVSIIFSIFLSKSISGPIIAVQKAANQLENGDLNIHIQTDLQDEIGLMSTSFSDAASQLRAYVTDIGNSLGAVANGNFRVTAKETYKGDFKQIETSIESIISSLDGTMHQINDSSDQVASGSDQVSSGAQALSQGATEQASSVQELAATIAEISGQVKSNAESANGASRLVEEVGHKIGESNAQMQQLETAMREINNCSQEIGKIIKTIEDIAFQTNILALNAAVEAARAGAAGKGFAVVADEVRNLASKSAEAAKHTTELIESSIKAVENGTQLANGTATALQAVVTGANQITQRVEEISNASNEQATAIAQVTMGVDQISSVVQTNSATAEQSAAASEELSGQAQILKGLVGRFTLRDNAATKNSAPIQQERSAHNNRSYASGSSKY